MDNFIQPGVTRDWFNNLGTGATVLAGDVVVVNQQLAIACVDIVSSATGSVQYTGVFSVPKASAAVIADGEMVMYDISAEEFDDNAATPATGDISNAATAVGAWAALTTTMNIMLADRIGTVG